MTDIVPAADLPPNEPVEIPVAPSSPGAPSLDTPVLASRAPLEPMLEKPKRLLSLDVFRGMTLALMTIVNNGGPGESYAPLDHAAWGHGWTPTDLVFPFFLFIVGVAIPFSLGKRSTIGQTRQQLLGTIWLRALSLFMVGQLLPAISNPHQWPTLPSWFHLLPAVRWFCVVYAYAAILLLLIPWRPTRRAWMIPVGICVSFYALLGIVALVNANAIKHGLPIENVGGMLKPAALRIPGILQRIGLCYGVAATVILFTGWRTALLTSLALCAVYTLLMFEAPFTDPATGDRLKGVVTQQHNFARSVDEGVFDKFQVDAQGHRRLDEKGKPIYVWHHTWRDYPDNEGIISTLPAIANALVGAIAGLWLRSLRPVGERAAGLFVFGLVAMLLGLWLNAYSLPIIKDIWTPSYAIFTIGLALLTLGSIYFIVDINGYRKWGWFFVVLGMNSIAVFVVNSWVLRVCSNIEVNNPYAGAAWNHIDRDAHISLGRRWALGTVSAMHALDDWSPMQSVNHFISGQVNSDWAGLHSGANISLAYAFSFLLVVWLVMLILYVCRIYVKI